jgi:hypothetical protein
MSGASETGENCAQGPHNSIPELTGAPRVSVICFVIWAAVTRSSLHCHNWRTRTESNSARQTSLKSRMRSIDPLWTMSRNSRKVLSGHVRVDNRSSNSFGVFNDLRRRQDPHPCDQCVKRNQFHNIRLVVL